MSNYDQLQRELWPASTPPAPVSGLAIASLTLGVLTVGPALFAALLGPGGMLSWLLWFAVIGVPGLLAITFGHVALASVRRAERRGRGIAIGGLILGYFAVLGPLLYRLFVG